MITKKTLAIAVLASTSVMLTGCQTSQGLYHWGDYESGLYEYYKNPSEQEALTKQLLTLIEKESVRIPPGIYAEYGTLLLQQGKKQEAIMFFEKEKELWPESQHLMNSMINAIPASPSQQNQEES